MQKYITVAILINFNEKITFFNTRLAITYNNLLLFIIIIIILKSQCFLETMRKAIVNEKFIQQFCSTFIQQYCF